MDKIKQYGGEIISLLEKDIKELTSKAGVYCRIFSRVKSIDSINHKMKTHFGIYDDKKKMQDLVGIRIVFYFQDDIAIFTRFMKYHFKYQFDSDSTTLSDIENAERKMSDLGGLKDKLFMPTRLNFVFCADKELKEKYDLLFRELNKENVKTPLIDYTFEIQFRSVLSEGWHEVEHDLRYKCKEDWANMQDESRILNGIYASLETNEHAMNLLFSSMAKKYQKEGNWEAMIRSIVRLHVRNNEISSAIRKFFKGNYNLVESITNVNREELLYALLLNKKEIDLTMDNIVMLINAIQIKSRQNNELLQYMTDNNPDIDILQPSVKTRIIQDKKKEESAKRLNKSIRLFTKESELGTAYTIIEFGTTLKNISIGDIVSLYRKHKAESIILDFNKLSAFDAWTVKSCLAPLYITKDIRRDSVLIRYDKLTESTKETIKKTLSKSLAIIIKASEKSTKVPNSVPDILIEQSSYTPNSYIIKLSDNLFL